MTVAWQRTVAALDPRWPALLVPTPDATTHGVAAWRQPVWWQDRLADTATRWGSTDPKINATLWWFAASHTWARLVAVPLLVGDRTACWDPAGRVWLRPYGYLGGPCDVLTLDRDDAGAALHHTWSVMESRLTAVSGTGSRTLRAIAGDSLASTLLGLSAEQGLGAAGSELCEELLAAARREGASLPRRTYLDVAADGRCHESRPGSPVRDGWHRVSPRTSCCRIYQTPSHDRSGRCGACPRRTADERLQRWAAAAPTAPPEPTA